MVRNFHQRGFSLLEILIVISLVTMIGSYSAYTGIVELRRMFLGDDTDSVFFALATAREYSLHGVCSTHICADTPIYGIRVTLHEILTFSGLSFESRDSGADQQVALQSSLVVDGESNTVFDPYGVAQNPFSVTIFDTGGDKREIAVATSSMYEKILK